MWVAGGGLLEELHCAANDAIERLPGDAHLAAVERVVADALRRTCKAFNQRRPEVVVIAHEADPRAGAAAMASATRRQADSPQGDRGGGQQRGQRGRWGQQQQQQQGGRRMSDREAEEVLAERKRRKQAERERQLLVAPKGGELDDMGAPSGAWVPAGGCSGPVCRAALGCSGRRWPPAVAGRLREPAAASWGLPRPRPPIIPSASPSCLPLPCR